MRVLPILPIRLLGSPRLLCAAGVACLLVGCSTPDTPAHVEPTPETAPVVEAPTNAPIVASTVSTNQIPKLTVYGCPSPNYDRRTLPVSMVVLHYTAAPLRESLNTLRNGKDKARVSAHYVVAEDGTIYQLVDESQRAWHAGVSRWGSITDVNSASIGIEIVNLGHDRLGRPRPYPARQIESVINLCLNIQARHKIVDVVGHSDVAPTRKIDPGELFPWRLLASRGVKVNTLGYKSPAALQRAR